MSNTGGLNIMIDDNSEGLIPKGDVGTQEIDVSAPDVENVIDPKTIAAEAAEAAAANHELEKEEEIEEEDSSKEPAPLNIIDDTNKPSKEDKLEETNAVTSNDSDDEYQTFKVLGKHFSDEGILDGFDEDMENTPEALQEMVSKTVEKGIESYKNSFSSPMAKRFLEYIENGGDPGNFIQTVNGPDYTSINSDQLDGETSIQKRLLQDYLSTQGESEEDIEDMITSYEDAGLLQKRSSAALKKLQKAQVDKHEQTISSQKKAKEEQIAKNQQILSDLKEKITESEEIGGFTLTKKIKNDFYSYITEVDPSTGKTGLMSDSSDPKNQLLMSYLYFNKFNFDKLGKKSKTKAAKSLEEKLGRFTDNSAKQKANRRTKVVKHEPGKLNLGPIKKMFG